MRSLVLNFDDEEFRELTNSKETWGIEEGINPSWRKFILTKCLGKKKWKKE